MKKIYLTIFFQLVALVVIFKVLFFDNTNFDKFALLKTEKLFILITFLIASKLLVTYLFFILIKIISGKKLNYLDITSIHLQGAVINQIFPGLGLVFRHYKLKLYSNINILTFSISQSLWSFYSLLVYFLVAGVLGLLVITNYLKVFALFSLFVLIALFINKMRYKIFNIIKKILYKIKITKKFVNDLKNVKKLILKNKKKFFLVFIGFLILLILDCFIFNLALNYFGVQISIIESSYIWILSTIIEALVLINFLGFFEMIMTATAALISPEIDYILIFAVNLRLINLISLILIIATSAFLRKFIFK